jgi:hypothetical protein
MRAPARATPGKTIMNIAFRQALVTTMDETRDELSGDYQRRLGRIAAELRRVAMYRQLAVGAAIFGGLIFLAAIFARETIGSTIALLIGIGGAIALSDMNLRRTRLSEEQTRISAALTRAEDRS